MITSIKLFIVLTLVTCFIAYWSDNLGKKLGKKRITFGGFRPRQTATAITMASSWAIMLVTLLVLMLVDQRARWALLRFDTIKDQNQQFERQTPILRARNQTLAQQAQVFEQKNQTLEQRNKSLLQNVALANANVTKLNQQAQGLKEQNEEQSRQSAIATRQNAIAARQNEAAYRHQMQIEQQNLVEKQQRLAQVNLALSTAQRSLNVALRSNNKTLKSNGELTQQLEQKKATVNTLEEQRKSLVSETSDLQTKVHDLLAKAADWQSKWYRTVSERDELASLAPLANGNILVTVNQVFAAQTIPANSSSGQVLTMLRQLLANGNDMVKKPPISGQELRLVPLNIEAQGQRIQLKEDEIISRLADYISSFDVPASVRLVAAYNQVAGETEIGGRMIVVPVRPALATGDVLSAKMIDGTQSDAHIFNQLLALVNDGEKAARGHGVVPPQSPDNQDFYAAGTNERIFEALRRIQAVRGPARVRLLAATDLSTADAARVRFEVSHFEVSRP